MHGARLCQTVPAGTPASCGGLPGARGARCAKPSRPGRRQHAPRRSSGHGARAVPSAHAHIMPACPAPAAPGAVAKANAKLRAAPRRRPRPATVLGGTGDDAEPSCAPRPGAAVAFHAAALAPSCAPRPGARRRSARAWPAATPPRRRPARHPAERARLLRVGAYLVDPAYARALQTPDQMGYIAALFCKAEWHRHCCAPSSWRLAWQARDGDSSWRIAPVWRDALPRCRARNLHLCALAAVPPRPRP